MSWSSVSTPSATTLNFRLCARAMIDVTIIWSFLVYHDATYEMLADFELVNGKFFEIVERRKTGAEIVNSDLNAQFTQFI